MKSDAIGKLVTKHAKATIAVVIVLTMIFGYSASQMEMSSDFKNFMPNDDISQAYNEISEDYYSTEMAQILIQYDNGNAVSKQALLDELELEKRLIEDTLVASNLQTPSEPANSVYSVADLVISTDMASRGAIEIMNSTISMVPALEQMNSSLDGVQGSLSMYLFYYSQNASSNETMQALYTSYYVLEAFLQAGDGIEMPEPPTNPPSMTVDQKIEYINNMSDEQIRNILAYGTPIPPSEMQEIATEFMQAADEIKSLSSDISTKSGNIAGTIQQCLVTPPVYSNATINYTFSASYMAFSQMVVQFQMLSDSMDDMMNMMDLEMLNMLMDMMHSMISSDFNSDTGSARSTLMMINLNGSADVAGGQGAPEDMLSVHQRIREIASSFNGDGECSVMSMRLMSEDIDSSMDETFNVLLPIAFLLVIIILVIVFRNIIDTLLGLMGLFMAIIWTYGIGVMLNLRFNMITTTVAILIVGLGIDYAIHTVMRYREELKDGNDVKESVMKMERNLGMALILATVTTTISFLSNLSSPIPPIRDYGIMNAIGIFSAFILFITFVPAVKVALDTKKEKKGRDIIKGQRKKSSVGVKHLNRALSAGAVGAEHHPWKVIAVVIILSLGAFYGAMNLSTDFSESDFLPQDTESYHILSYITDNFNSSGMEESYILVKGDMTSPELLVSMDQTLKNMEDDRYVSTADSQNIVYLIKNTAARDANFSVMINNLDINGDGLPDSGIKQVYDYLFEHEEGAKYVLYRTDDGTYKSTLVRFKPTSQTNSQHAVLYGELKSDIIPLKDAGFSAVITGASIMTYTITSSLQHSQWNSLILTLIMSLAVLTFVFWHQKRAPMLGIISTLPVLIALLWSMGIMYLIGMNFDLMTVSITSLTIGLGITYSIHLTHRFTEELETKRPEEAMRVTVLNTGSAIFGAAATTMGGFGVLMLSSMPPMQNFGMIATLSILLSFLLSVFVLPTFLVMWARRKKETGTDGSKGSE